MAIEVKPVQPENAVSSILIILSGIVIDVKPVQSPVFVYCFISAFYALKGRKVKT